MGIAFIRWNINPEIVNIMGFSLRYYGVFFAGGIMLCILALKRIFRNENIALDKLDTLTIYGVLGIFVGARLGHCFFYDPEYYFNHPLQMLLPIQQKENGGYEFIGYQGLASHGGAAGLIIALIFYARKTHESIINTADLLGVVAPLGSCFIRLGNLMNSEMIGFPTDVSWAFIFVRQDNLPRHPAQLYEAVSYLLIFFLLVYLYKSHRPKLQNGFFFGSSILLIFTARFFIEFVKVRQVPFEEQMTFDMGQLLSIPFIIVGLGFAVYGVRETNRKKNRMSPEIFSSRVLKAPVDIVYRAFADPSHLKNWWGPEGFTNTIHEFDLRPGGKWTLTMHDPEAGNYENASVFKTVRPMEMITWTRLTQPLFDMELEFKKLDDTKTEISFRMIFASVELFEKIEKFARPKNEENFDRLEREIENMLSHQ